jgi:hypothetical protein
MKTDPGVYRSDVSGHLFVLKLNPVRVTCVICMETCDTSAYKGQPDRKKAAAAFMEKHGALDGKIADTLLQLIPTSNEPKQ